MGNSTPNYDDLLVRYLDGELSEQEKAHVEKMLDNDPALSSELENLKQTREAIRIHGVREKVAGIHHHMMKEMSAPVKQISHARKIVRYTISIAAAILVIVLGITIFNFYNLSPSEVIASNYISYELPRSRDTANIESNIERAYRERRFDVVTNEKNKEITNDQRMLVAMSYFEQKKYAEAIEEYKKVIDGSSPTRDKSLHEAAQYYMTLAFIGNKDYDFAIDWLTVIHNDKEHLYHERVNNRMIRQVKMLKWR